MSKLICIRHAQASFGAADYDQLSDLGYTQSAHLGDYLAGTVMKIDKVYIGPLKRHRQTFETVRTSYEKIGQTLPKPEILAGLAEHRGPEILRQSMPQLIDAFPEVRAWHQDTENHPERKVKNHFKVFNFFMKRWATNDLGLDLPDEHQDWISFKAEVSKAIDTILADRAKGITSAAFTSGGTISAIMGYALDMHDDARIIGMNDSVINTSISEFKYSDSRISLHRFNLTPHLHTEELITYV